MNNDEAKFLLGAYRPNGQDASDSLFSEALAQTRGDPPLGTWFEGQVRFDAAVSAALRAVPPPPGLRAMILAGIRVSHRPVPGRRWLAWFGAAAIAALLVLGAVLRLASPRPELGELARFALRDTTVDEALHLGSVRAMRAIEERIAETSFRLGAGLPLDLARLRSDGCRIVRVAGREVLEICFGRDHEFHLYLAPRNDFAAGDAGGPNFTAEGRLSAASWIDSRLAYVLVTSAGIDALRQRLGFDADPASPGVLPSTL